MEIEVPQHYDILLQIVRGLHFHDTFLEIGASDGAHFNKIAPMFARKVAVDIAPVGEFLCEGTEFYQMPSDDFFAYVGNSLPLVDYCFIDADHRKEFVLRDFQNALNLIKPCSGIIALHDVYPPNQGMINGGCWNAWEAAVAIRRMTDVEIVVLPVTCMGIAICRYVPDGKSLHWMT